MRGRWAAGLLALLVLLAVAATTEDPLSQRQYHVRKVRAVAAWQVSQGDDSIVAVVDTGVDLDHPDLVGRLVDGVDLVDRGTPPDDGNGHGTLVAGIVAATAGNDEGGAGVAPRAFVMPVRVLDDEGEGTSDVVAEGIRWAVREGADVVNLSLADVPGQDRSPAELITTDVELAIRQAELAGVLVVAAAGNDAAEETPYGDGVPVLVVGATDRRDRVWPDSNADDRTMFAPGVRIVSTYRDDGYAVADGTSFAAPIVAGGAAILLAHGHTRDETRDRLADTAVDVGRGVGRIDVAAAIGVARRQRPADPPKEEPRRGGGTAGGVRPPSPIPVEPRRADPPRSVRRAPPPAVQPIPDEEVEAMAAPTTAPPVVTEPSLAAPAPAPAPTGAPRRRPGPLFLVAGGLLAVMVIGLLSHALERAGR